MKLVAKLAGKIVTYEHNETFIVEARGAKKEIRHRDSLTSALSTLHRMVRVKGVRAKIKQAVNGTFKTLYALNS